MSLASTKPAPKHTSDPICPLCEKKLRVAHPILQEWFYKVKLRHPHVHVSWSYRDQDAQNLAFKEGKSKCQWPKSKHNKIPALALDLFVISEERIASFPHAFYKKLHEEIVQDGDHITWGGTFKSIIDGDHFEIKDLH